MAGKGFAVRSTPAAAAAISEWMIYNHTRRCTEASEFWLDVLT